MTRRHGKRCRVCGKKVSEPHEKDCSNQLRNCEFKKRKRREEQEKKR